MIALLKEILFSICLAILFPTRNASNSGRLISNILSCISLAVIFLSSSFNLSTSDPALPIIIPGLAVVIVIIINLRVLSIITLETLARESLA